MFELTGSPAATGFAFVTESVPAVVIGPIAGVAVDRWDRRRIMLAVTVGQAGCILPVALVHQPGQVAIVYLALLAESALGQFYLPAAPDPVMGRTCSIFFAVEGAAGLAGTAIGGVLAAVAGFTPAVAAAAAAIAGAALISALPATDFAVDAATSVESRSGSSAWRGPLPEVMRRVHGRSRVHQRERGRFLRCAHAVAGHSLGVRRPGTRR